MPNVNTLPVATSRQPRLTPKQQLLASVGYAPTTHAIIAARRESSRRAQKAAR